MKFSAVLLAAGASLRMRGRHKMLLPAPVEPVVRRSARSVEQSGACEVVVVTGHGHERVAEALAGLRVRLVHNPDYRQGQMVSVNTGLAALVQPCDAVMVCLADQVLLTPDDYAELARAFARRPHGSILVPCFEGRRGNPVMFDSRHMAGILAGRHKLGCRKLVQDNPEAVYAHEVAHDAYVSDLDTPEDYARILRRLAASESLAP
ncbi:nucleotidyltransferase family protein [Parapusillimonas granuli]|uniref:Nucleotidyltransferase family protein n=1 Tax=Parapusillimonas granuli TaxID=380911 RepID=A0A853FRA1_9BURK|nr:nucleotidyltransferase family protein [Parapusillimonas granuli]MBB5213526.1 molybdenum cofactor cytidylyltransferase [Parapusillimonas granuli]NYT48364.1 nucleotidyltransferase family protein [Parapusillimonas granuli]